MRGKKEDIFSCLLWLVWSGRRGGNLSHLGGGVAEKPPCAVCEAPGNEALGQPHFHGEPREHSQWPMGRLLPVKVEVAVNRSAYSAAEA